MIVSSTFFLGFSDLSRREWHCPATDSTPSWSATGLYNSGFLPHTLLWEHTSLYSNTIHTNIIISCSAITSYLAHKSLYVHNGGGAKETEEDIRREARDQTGVSSWKDAGQATKGVVYSQCVHGRGAILPVTHQWNVKINSSNNFLDLKSVVLKNLSESKVLCFTVKSPKWCLNDVRETSCHMFLLKSLSLLTFI